ncbi:MAG: ABC transporter substrate-binding protein [Micromonosporaceae bacterium]
MSHHHPDPRISRRNLLRAAGLGVGGSLMLGAAGCRGFGGSSSSDPKSLTMTYWEEGKRGQIGLDLNKLFLKKHKDVKLDAEYSSFVGYYDKLATRVAGGNPPDIFQLHITTLAEYAERGACLDLKDLWSGALGLDQAPEAIQAACKIGDKRYFVPLGVATQPAVIYNGALLEQLGVAAPAPDWTLDDMLQFGREVNRASRGKMYGVSDFGGGDQGLGAFLRSQGKDLFTTSGGLGFGEAELTEWYEYWQELRDAKACVPMKISAGAVGFQNNPLIKGQAAVAFTASSKGLQGMQNLSKDPLSVLPFARRGKDGKPGTQVCPIEWFAFSSKLSDDEATLAAQLCRFWLTDPKAVAASRLWHGVPVFPDKRAAAAEDPTPVEEQVQDNLELVVEQEPVPALPYPVGAAELFEKVSQKNNQEIGFGKTTVDKAVKRFFGEAERVLG